MPTLSSLSAAETHIFAATKVNPNIENKKDNAQHYPNLQ
jgi:hypothetical protein